MRCALLSGPMAVATTLLVVAAGCGSTGGDEAGAAGTKQNAGSTTSAAGVAQAVRALQTAGRRAPNATPYDLEDTRYRGQRVWEIDVALGKQRPHKLLVSRDGRRVVKESRERRDDDAAKVQKAKVQLVQALQTAAKRAGGRFDEAEIDRLRGGRLVWEATFERSGGAETRVTVDARTGKVIRIQREERGD